jgi:putative SOS response-associated peptidase YedK
MLDVTSCTIITETAAKPISKLHTWQPVILDPAYYDVWLSPETLRSYLKEILSHDIDGKLEFYRVGREVNATVVDKKRNDTAVLFGPINPL